MRRIVMVLMCIGLVASVGQVRAEEYDWPGCVWGRPTDPDVVNVFYPDEGATYWGARAPLPVGARLIMHGDYPHARYMSFNGYDEQLAPVDALADIEIAPDTGSANPFVAGADRTDPARAYTVEVVAGPAPEVRAPNTLYVSAAGNPAPYVNLLYRVYVPDAGTNLTGDTGLPAVDLVTAGGDVVHLTARCDPAQANQPVGSQAGALPVQEAFADGSAPGSAATLPASDPLVWEKFFNLAHIQAAFATRGTPARAVVDELLGTEQGGYLSNAHNAYVVSIGHRGLGPVLVIEGTAPTVPATRAGAIVMGQGDMRYWSLCTNERHSTRWIDCLVDQDALVGEDGRYTVVVSSPEDRPANAIESCGISWLAWGTSPETLLILRHMLPDEGFTHAIQRVARPADVAAVVGPYLPAGSHTTTAAFEARGCAA